MDFFVVPTVRFHLLYVWFVIDYGRRRILHFNVPRIRSLAGYPAAARCLPDEPSRFLILDNDSILSADVARSIMGFGIHPRRTAFRSPRQWTAERFVGSVRRELLDRIVVLGEYHLRRLLTQYVDYYNAERVHTSIGDAPAGRPAQNRPSLRASEVGSPRVGGLHHRYAWREAA